MPKHLSNSVTEAQARKARHFLLGFETSWKVDEGGRFTKGLPDPISREMFCIGSAFGWAQKRLVLLQPRGRNIL